MNTSEFFSIVAANAVAQVIGHKFALSDLEVREIRTLKQLNTVWKEKAFEYNSANGYLDNPPEDCPYGWLEFNRNGRTTLAYYGPGEITVEVSDYLKLTFYPMGFPKFSRKITLSFVFRIDHKPGNRFRGLMLNRDAFRLFPKAIDKLWEIDRLLGDFFIGEVHELMSLYRERGTHPYIEIAYFLFLKNGEYLIRRGDVDP